MEDKFFNSSEVDRIIRNALSEDIRSGDITTSATTNSRTKAKAVITAKSKGILAGIHIAARTFTLVNDNISLFFPVEDGREVSRGDDILKISGSASSILKAERTALNILCRMSGIATITNIAVEAVKGTGAKVLDTRKTMPGLRVLDKYAVKTGGGTNHRYGLYDMFLIKDNHIAAAGGISNAVRKCIDFREKKGLDSIIIAEADTIEKAEDAVKAGADRILLDNMTPEKIKKAVNVLGGKVKLEVSGGVGLKNIRKYAETGVDYISMGMLTHSVPAVDFSLNFD
ncbi:MAG: carboxylating nicotinate-nucleotide diphosphorylase [bacterium]|nr:carboxylating nicotinate-nucleotide diphosphorylase [bacterium]